MDDRKNKYMYGKMHSYSILVVRVSRIKEENFIFGRISGEISYFWDFFFTFLYCIKVTKQRKSRTCAPMKALLHFFCILKEKRKTIKKIENFRLCGVNL
jgi:hypothetical protein